MLPHLDTYATALTIDRELTLKRAERRARLVGTGYRHDAPGPAIARATATTRRGGITRAIGSLLAILLPSHA
jgi:hypothetical protein